MNHTNLRLQANGIDYPSGVCSMHYTITARFKPDTAADFYRRLRDGTIENQKPDGKEIVA